MSVQVDKEGRTVTLAVKPLAANCAAVVVHLPDGRMLLISCTAGWHDHLFANIPERYANLLPSNNEGVAGPQSGLFPLDLLGAIGCRIREPSVVLRKSRIHSHQTLVAGPCVQVGDSGLRYCGPDGPMSKLGPWWVGLPGRESQD